MHSCAAHPGFHPRNCSAPARFLETGWPGLPTFQWFRVPRHTGWAPSIQPTIARALNHGQRALWRGAWALSGTQKVHIRSRPLMCAIVETPLSKPARTHPYALYISYKEGVGGSSPSTPTDVFLGHRVAGALASAVGSVAGARTGARPECTDKDEWPPGLTTSPSSSVLSSTRYVIPDDRSDQPRYHDRPGARRTVKPSAGRALDRTATASK